MPTDITQFFKARCKTLVQRRQKEQLGMEEEKKKLLAEEPSISYRKHSLVARKYAMNILEFGHVVIAKRREYLDFNALMATMSSSDRDRFDQDSERCLRSLSQLVLQLLEMISKDRSLSEQEKEHLKAVCALLEKDIKKIGRVVTEMRRLRLTAMASRKEMSKLSSMLALKQRHRRPISPGLESTSSGSPRAEIRRRNVAQDDEDRPLLRRKQQENLVALDEHHQQQQDTYEPELDLSPAEMDQLQKENDKLFEKFTSAQDTVNSLETQIFEIQRLQECFSDKVFDQEKGIDVINELAVGTTESLKDANEFIRRAISNSASRRVIILFCIVVLTLTLLFLDWYNL